jgi:hypothetical protein
MSPRSIVLDEPRVVQFLHPGREHGPAEGQTFCPWNTGGHKRKLMEHPGRALDGSGRLINGPIRFWAEYEPPTLVERLAGSPRSGRPEFLHRVAPMGRRPQGGQNTDPWVFERFLYSNCQQWRETGPTALTDLADRSLVLFGSHLGGDFILDTCFVVGSSLAYDRLSIRDEGNFPPGFQEAVLEPLGCGVGTCDRGNAKRLYTGAEFEEMPESPFSFVPCIPSSGGSFARPVIRGPFISPGQRQGFGFSVNPASAWNQVRNQVLEAGLLLGVRIQAVR